MGEPRPPFEPPEVPAGGPPESLAEPAPHDPAGREVDVAPIGQFEPPPFLAPERVAERAKREKPSRVPAIVVVTLFFAGLGAWFYFGGYFDKMFGPDEKKPEPPPPELRYTGKARDLLPTAVPGFTVQDVPPKGLLAFKGTKDAAGVGVYDLANKPMAAVLAYVVANYNFKEAESRALYEAPFVSSRRKMTGPFADVPVAGTTVRGADVLVPKTKQNFARLYLWYPPQFGDVVVVVLARSQAEADAVLVATVDQVAKVAATTTTTAAPTS